MIMRQATGELTIDSRHGLQDVTRPIADWVDAQRMGEGLLTVFCRHTSASLVVTENVSREVWRDMEAWIARLAPEDERAYEHDDEGLDDMPAHLRSVVTNVSLSIPLIGGRLALGTWQGVFLFEHRRRPHRRRLALHLLGE